MIAPLAHCASCDLWLRPDEGCLHMAPLPLGARGGSGQIRLSPNVAFEQPFNAGERRDDPDAFGALFPSHHAAEVAHD